MKLHDFNKPGKQMRRHIFHGGVISFSWFIKIINKVLSLLTSRNTFPFVKIEQITKNNSFNTLQ